MKKVYQAEVLLESSCRLGEGQYGVRQPMRFIGLILRVERLIGIYWILRYIILVLFPNVLAWLP
jgi:hypothetical protein